MPKVSLCAKGYEIAHIPQPAGRAVDKVREARMLPSDKAPDHPRRDECADYVSCPDMHHEGIFGQIGDAESRDQSPMKDPYEQIPYINLASGGCGVGGVHDTHQYLASIVVSIARLSGLIVIGSGVIACD
jgi:hypothetical protein